MFIFSVLQIRLSQNVELCKRLSTPPGKKGGNKKKKSLITHLTKSQVSNMANLKKPKPKPNTTTLLRVHNHRTTVPDIYPEIYEVVF